MKDQAVILKKGKNRAIRNRHHWIFSGVIKSFPAFEDEDILEVISAEGDFLGYAYFNKERAITGRMHSFDETRPHQAIEKNLWDAIALRRILLESRTNALQLVNGEGDNLPGLIVDQYGDVLVLQIATLGMEKLKPFVLELLVKKLSPRSIYEKSDLPTRRDERLEDFEGLLYGQAVEAGEILEEGLCFRVDFVQGQKRVSSLTSAKCGSSSVPWPKGKKC